VSESEQHHQGVLKFYKHQRERGGFGFIVRDGGRSDDFVHARDLDKSGLTPEMLKGGKTRLSYRMTLDQRNQKYKATGIRIED
jgi:cold shock CspA family protein